MDLSPIILDHRLNPLQSLSSLSIIETRNVLARWVDFKWQRIQSMNLSLAAYVDTNLVGSGKISRAAILGQQGGVWAASPGYNVSRYTISHTNQPYGNSLRAAVPGRTERGDKCFQEPRCCTSFGAAPCWAEILHLANFRPQYLSQEGGMS